MVGDDPTPADDLTLAEDLALADNLKLSIILTRPLLPTVYTTI